MQTQTERPRFLAQHGLGLLAITIGTVVSYALSSLVPAVSALTIAVFLGAAARSLPGTRP